MNPRRRSEAQADSESIRRSVGFDSFLLCISVVVRQERKQKVTKISHYIGPRTATVKKNNTHRHQIFRRVEISAARARERDMGNQHAARPFTEKDAEVLMKLSGKSEKEIREWYESFNDESNQTGRMNKRQFQLYYTKLKKNPRLQEITDHIFRAFDTDHSGTASLVSDTNNGRYFHCRHCGLC